MVCDRCRLEGDKQIEDEHEENKEDDELSTKLNSKAKKAEPMLAGYA